VLQPVGLPHTAASPRDEHELVRVAHGLLRALAAIHAANFVYRDLRWPNVAAHYDRSHWFLLDLEMCVREDQGALPAAALASWDAGTLVDGRYVAASDLYQLYLLVFMLVGWGRAHQRGAVASLVLLSCTIFVAAQQLLLAELSLC